MTISAACPVCGNPQAMGLLDDACTTRLERELGDVAAIVGELDVTLSKQARIGTPGKSGLARERIPINTGAMLAADALANVLTTWARDIYGEAWRPSIVITVYRDPWAKTVGPFCWSCDHASCRAMRLTKKRLQPLTDQAAAALLSAIPTIRRHPAVAELVDEITDAVRQARRAVDRPADRIYLSQCMVETPDEDGRMVTCLEEIWARPGASETQCKVCGTEHPVAERRAWLLKRCEDYLFTVKEASEIMGEVGHITVTQASIRGYLHRKRIAYRPGTSRIRLGDLLDVVMDEGERKSA